MGVTNAKPAKLGNTTFRSKLEKHCYKLLKDADIQFSYEPYKITLMEAFEFNPPSGEKIGTKKKSFKKQRKRIQALTYTPDFVGKDGVIETKGFFYPQAKLKWKLFKKGMHDNGIEGSLYMPSNIKEIKTTIELIKEKNAHRN